MMFKNLMLNARVTDYVNKFELNEEDNEANVRKYICYTYFSQIQPDRLDRDLDLLEKICETKLFDDNIIGAAVTLNNQLLTTETDVDDILQIDGKGKFDIYVIAYKGEITPEKIVRNVFDKKNKEFEFSKIIQYIYTQKIITKWEDLPNLNIIFISEDVEEIVCEKTDSFIQKIHHFNEEKLLRIAQSNENEYKAILSYTDGFLLPKEDDEGQTFVGVCEANKLIEILKNEDGLIRTNMFDANVRAYQGDTDINKEMVMTLHDSPRNFVLFNNGITVVCSKLNLSGKTVEINNPQVVNGCQTCNSIYKAYNQGTDLSKAKVVVKVIETMGSTVAQGIVRGTNRQNIVYEEAFETIRQFHKDLEEFIHVMNVNGFHKVFYERRSKQYNSEPQIKPYQKINFRMLIQSMVAMYVNKLEISYRHESKLLTDYKDVLFVEEQSFYPYYVAALLSSNLDYIMKKNSSLKDLRNYKMHILFMIQELNMGESPNIDDTKSMDEYCKKFLDILGKTSFEKNVMTAADKFRYYIEKWIEKKGYNYRFSIKDNSEFTEFLLNELRGRKSVKNVNKVYQGVVMNVTTDKYGNLFGFITHKPENMYFNELDNPDLNISYEGKRVAYRITTAGGGERAINVRLL